MHNVRAKERRINAYFGKSFEDNELWEFLEQYPEEERTQRLKYLARLGMSVESQGSITVARAPQTRQHTVTNQTTRKKKSKPISSVRTEKPPSTDSIEASFDSLNNIELVTQSTIDPTTRMEKAQNRFIDEEDDPEVLELLKLSVSDN